MAQDSEFYQLFQSDKVLGELIEAIPDALLVVDMVGRITLVNRQAEQLFGYERQEMLGQQVEIFLPALLRERHRQHRLDYLHNPRIRLMGEQMDIHALHRDGRHIPIEIQLSPLKTDTGTFVVSTIRDVTEHRRIAQSLRESEEHYLNQLERQVSQRTVELSRVNRSLQEQIIERQKAEVALKESETQYRSLIEQSNDAIYLLYDGKFEMINRRFAEMFDVTLADVQAPDFNFMQFVAPESKELVLERDRKLQEGESLPPYYEFQAIRPDGQRLFLDASVSYIDYRGKIATQGILRDVTKRKQVERDLQRRANELEALVDISSALRAASSVEAVLAALQQNLDILGGSNLNIFMLEPNSEWLVLKGWYPSPDKELDIRYQLGQGITGWVAQSGQPYITDNVVEDPLAKIHPTMREQMAAVKSSISLPLRAEEAIVGVINIGLYAAHQFSDEEIRVLTAVAEMAGSTLQRIMIWETLEQRVEARTRELAEANRRLKELDALKSKFVSDVSHELRTPVTNLNLYVDLLERSEPDKHDRYLLILKKEAKRLSQLITDILDLARLELEQEEINFAPVDLNELARQVVTAHELHAQANGLQLRLETGQIPHIQGDSNRLAQVLNNLVTNAINYTTQGEVKIATILDTEAQALCLTVSDSGRGIHPEDMPYLFERFYRGRQASQSTIPGTGLGLAIVKEIVDLHQGDIVVDSRPEQGTTFRIWFPLAQAHDD